jgi:hypothetical protein
MNAFKTLLIGATLTAALAACKKEEAAPTPEAAPAPAAAATTPAPPAAAPAEISVSGVALSTVIGADKNVVSPATNFAPTDTIYAVVATKNASSGATLAAKWTSEDGKTIHDESTGIAPTGDAFTDFKYQSPTGLAPGKYKVEISLNGNAVNSVEFGVK